MENEPKSTWVIMREALERIANGSHTDNLAKATARDVLRRVDWDVDPSRERDTDQDIANDVRACAASLNYAIESAERDGLKIETYVDVDNTVGLEINRPL